MGLLRLMLEDDGCDRDGKISQKPWDDFFWIHIPKDLYYLCTKSFHIFSKGFNVS